MTTAWMIGIFATLLIAILIAVPIALQWRNKRKRIHAFERLLDDIGSRQQTRIDQLKHQFADQHQLDEDAIQNLSTQLIAAEKSFLQYFIDQQLRQDSVEDFYQQLCKLLDQYLVSMTSTNQTISTSPASKQASSQPTVSHRNDTQSDSWGDVFD